MARCGGHSFKSNLFFPLHTKICLSSLYNIVLKFCHFSNYKQILLACYRKHSDLQFISLKGWRREVRDLWDKYSKAHFRSLALKSKEENSLFIHTFFDG